MSDDRDYELTPEEIVKVTVETEEIRQRMAFEAERQKITLAQMKFSLRESEINAAAKERQNKVVLADDLYNRYYYFDSSVNEKSVQAALVRLAFWHRTMPGEPIKMVFNSPGGDITSGFALYDYLQELKALGHEITTHSIGYAASMGGVLLQAGSSGKRTMGKEAMILIHQGAFGAGGTAGQMKDMQKYFDKLLDRIRNIFLTRAEEAYKADTATKKLTLKMFNTNWERQDWWLTSEDALELGIIDGVV